MTFRTAVNGAREPRISGLAAAGPGPDVLLSLHEPRCIAAFGSAIIAPRPFLVLSHVVGDV